MICSNCSHLEVCRKFDEMENIQKKIDALSYTEGGEVHSVKDLSWLTVEIKCKHFSKSEHLTLK